MELVTLVTSSFLNTGISMAVKRHYIKKENFLGAKNKNVEQMYRVLLLAKIRFGIADILYIYK